MLGLFQQLPAGYAAGKGYWRMKKDKFEVPVGCNKDFVIMKNLVDNPDETDDQGAKGDNEVKVGRTSSGFFFLAFW